MANVPVVSGCVERCHSGLHRNAGPHEWLQCSCC